MGYLDTFNFQMQMTRLFMDIGQRGLRVDISEKCKQQYMAGQQLKLWLKDCKKLVGYEMNPNSPPQVMKHLYDEKGMEVQYNRDVKTGKWKPSSDENAIKKLTVAYPKDEFLDFMLKWRKLSKLKSSYLDAGVDPDGRMRCSWGWNKTGRNNTSKNPFGTGMNLQTQPRNSLTLESIIDPKSGEQGIINVKKLFIADPGCLLLEADGKQAEARIVAYSSGDKNYINLFETGQDIHSINATALIQYIEPGRIITKKDPLERHLGKIASHGTPYGIEPDGINEEIIKNLGMKYVLPRDQLLRFQKDYFKMYPGVKRWQRGIRDKLSKGLPIVNAFGRTRQFLGKIDKKTLKEAYAQEPQSTVPDLINRGILAWEGHGYGKHFQKGMICPVLMQCHDSVIMQIPREYKHKGLYQQIKDCFEMPITVGGQEIVIPVEIAVGKSWGDKETVA